MESTELLSVSDLSRYLGASESAIRSWADAGRLKALRTVKNGTRLFTRAEARRFRVEMKAQRKPQRAVNS
jgi:excisionase family DNA binding protein